MTAVVYVPCVEPAGPDEPVHVVCAQPRPGVPVLAVWSSLEALVGACGQEQPWVAVPLDAAADLRDAAGAVAVVLDAAAPTVSWA